jgi:hypothetical protein
MAIRDKGIIIRLSSVFLIFAIVSTLISGCSSNSQKDGSIKLSGPWDLYYLSVLINNDNASGQNIPKVTMNPSLTDINDLKKGKCDAVIIGKEPNSADLTGLKDYVIGYDAICVVIDENSYVGGQYGITKKTAGLQGLSLDNIKELFSTGQCAWDGAYYTRDSLDPNSWLAATGLGWLLQPKVLSCYFHLIPGKYDIQTALFQDLGLDEKTISSSWKTFTSPGLNLEEELLSTEYKTDGSYSQGADFAFKIGFASRRVMTVAPSHIPIRVVSIDGINPVDDAQAIYDGSYSLSRKIHILVRQDSSPQMMKLVDYLQSDSGQKLISDAGYLPVKPDK